jgi:hypothetical protein
MSIFGDAFYHRVTSNGRMLLRIDYSKPQFIPSSQYLPWEVKKRIILVIAGSESGSQLYTACNRDGEFEGLFSPSVVNYSKFSADPRHVGLSFGLIQFTQEGPLGALLKLMNDRDPQLFNQIFGVHATELLEVTSRTGDYLHFTEEIFNINGVAIGNKNVRRRPSVQPVAGYELWHDFWVEKFKTSGKQEIFQQAQVELAARNYMDNCLAKIVSKSISEKSLALVYDRSVNQGSGIGQSLITQCIEADEKTFWTN